MKEKYNFTKEEAREMINKIRYRINTASKMVGSGEDGNAFEDLEYAILAIEELERMKNKPVIELPVPIGSTVYEVYRFANVGAWEIEHHKICLEDLDKIGKTVFLTLEAAEAVVKEKEKEV